MTIAFKKVILIALVLPLICTSALAQSSKSKSKDRFREKNADAPDPLEQLKANNAMIPDDPDNMVRIRNAANINTELPDGSPAYYKDDGLVFTSANKLGPRDNRGNPFSNLFFAPFDINREPAFRQSFPLYTGNALNEGQVTFAKNGKRMFFTNNNNNKGAVQTGGNGKVVHLKIYEAKRGKYEWEEKKELPFNNDNYSCKHPTLSADGTKLFFSSNMPGGEGGYDIWMVEQVGSTWSKPVNLGPTVNSKKDETFPFMHEGGTLFFSSNGRIGIGGYDIFMLNKNEDGTSEIYNLGSSFNSEKDDIGFILNADGNSGFFTSNREGGKGGDDVYVFTIEKGINKLKKPVARSVKIVVSDAKTGAPIKGVSLRVFQPSEDGFISANKKSAYQIDLTPIQGRPEALSFQLVRKGAEELGNPDYFTNANGEAKALFLPYRTYLVLASFDGYGTSEKLYTLSEDASGTLRLMLTDAPQCHRVSGIVLTDQMGTRIAFATLRLTHKASGHQEMVRTNLNGEFDVCLPQPGDYTVTIQREGFLPGNFAVKATKEGVVNQEIRLKPTNVNGEVSQPLSGIVREGFMMVMDKVRFESGRSTLNQTATKHLDAIYDLMKQFSGMEIEVIVHTDTRTDTDAISKYKISGERAENVRKYLVYRGISEKRISITGKGKKEPRNRCKEGVECSEAEHEFNERLEILVKKVGI
jgi:outer membrane protein OmpA-like peptidoglycan-associated protein